MRVFVGQAGGSKEWPAAGTKDTRKPLHVPKGPAPLRTPGLLDSGDIKEAKGDPHAVDAAGTAGVGAIRCTLYLHKHLVSVNVNELRLG